MTDEAKALAKRVAPTYAHLGNTSDRVRGYIYALEAQATRDERLIETQAREIERLREALEWALAEIEGRTRYSPNNIYEAEEQRANALDCARAALAGDSHDQ